MTNTDHFLTNSIKEILSVDSYNIEVSPFINGNQSICITSDCDHKKVVVFLERDKCMGTTEIVAFNNECTTVFMERKLELNMMNGVEIYALDWNPVKRIVIPLSNIYDVVPEVRDRWMEYCTNIFNQQCRRNIRSFLDAGVTQ